MKILVIGGGAVGKTIAREFSNRKSHQVTIVDFEREEDQKNPIPNTTWVSGDACDQNVLKKADAANADILVAATGDDQSNLVVSLIAKTEFGIKKTIARVNHPKNSALFDSNWGVDYSVSTPAVLENLIEDAISEDEIVPILNLSRTGAKILKLSIGEKSPHIKKRISEIEVPENVVLCAVNRGDFTYGANEEIIIESGDQLIFLSSGQTVSKL